MNNVDLMANVLVDREDSIITAEVTLISFGLGLMHLNLNGEQRPNVFAFGTALLTTYTYGR